VDQKLGSQCGFAGADVGRLQYGADCALGGYGILARELPMGGHHAAEVLRPWLVGGGVEHQLPDLLGLGLLWLRRESQEGMHLAGGKESYRLLAGMLYPIDVLRRIEADVPGDDGQDQVRTASERGHRHGPPLEIADRPDSVGPEELITPDMYPGQDDERKS